MSWRVWLLAYIASVSCLTPHGHAIPASTASRECSSELVQLKKGAPLSLECGSDCTSGRSFGWWKEVEGSSGSDSHKIPIEGETGVLLYRNAASLVDGGIYTCQCLPDGLECQYNVTILPEVEFTASVEATHYGDSYDLSCTVESYPATFAEIRDASGIRVHKQIVKTLEPFKTLAFAVVPDAEEMDYVCHVGVHYGGQLVSQEEKKLHIQIYDPPYIVYMTEYIIHDPSDYGKPGLLTCTVDTSPDIAIHVAWWAHGKKLENSEKYQMDFQKTNEEDVLEYRLKVSDVQHSDIGSYLCQLATDFAVEDSQAVWIQTDFRRATPSQVDGPDSHQVDLNEDKKAGSFGIARLVLCGLVLVVGAAVVYRCVSRGSQRLPEHGKKERGSPTRELPVTDYGYHVGVTKRK